MSNFGLLTPWAETCSRRARRRADDHLVGGAGGGCDLHPRRARLQHPARPDGHFQLRARADRRVRHVLRLFVMGDLGWPWWVAIVGGAAAGGLIAAVEELLAIRPVVAKGSHALLVPTVGASVIIEGVLLATWGSTTRSVNFFAGNNAFSLLGGRLLPVDLWLIAAAVVISFGLHAVSRYTLWGLAGRATTDDMAAAVVRGVNVTRLRMSAFILAGALGGALGPLIGPVAGIDVSTGISLTIYGFVALALGGFGSFPGCLFGGMAIGLVESYASR